MAAPGTLSIKLRCASWQQLATIYERDLCRGTMFLRTPTPPPPGTVIRIDLTLPSASVIALTGVVDRGVADPRGAGVELRLAPLADGALWLIESALAAELGRGTPATGWPAVGAAGTPGPAPIASLDDGADLAVAEADLLRALAAEVESLRALNPFLVLGVGLDAGDVEVRRAFGELTKRYHPDRFARYASNELRHLAGEIFILIRDAYRRLVDEAGRVRERAALDHARTAAAGQAAGQAAGESLEAELRALEDLIDAGRLDEALAGYKGLQRRHGQDRPVRAGIELCEALLALGLRDRLAAAQRLEAALEIDPTNERAARALAELRRQATDERKGLLARLMGRPEGKEG